MKRNFENELKVFLNSEDSEVITELISPTDYYLIMKKLGYVFVEQICIPNLTLIIHNGYMMIKAEFSLLDLHLKILKI